MSESNKAGQSSGRPNRRSGRRRYFRQKGEAATPGSEKSESAKLGGRTGAKRTSAQRNNPQRGNEQRNNEPKANEARPGEQRGGGQRGNQRGKGQRQAVAEQRSKAVELDVRRSRRRRRRRGDRSELTEQRQESVIVSSSLDYATPQSVFVYTYVTRGDLGERYESKVEHFSSIGRKIEDYGIDLSQLITEDGTIQLPKMNSKITDWEDEPAEINPTKETD